MKSFSLNLGQTKGRRSLDKVEGFPTCIGSETHITGKITGPGHCIVHGKVEGDCDLPGTLVVGETGQWLGNIVAEDVLIAGLVEGHVTAKNKMEILSSARVKGSINSAILAIAEGAVHDGQVHMPGDASLKQFSDKRSNKEEK